jgi:predicted transcriptional regulator
LPHIKKLTDSSLVTQQKGNYELTDLGDQVFKKVQSLVSVLILLERDNYWIEHDLSGIPQYLLDRIGDLKDCKLVERDPSQIFEPNKELLNLFSSSNHLMAFSSIYRPEFLFLYSESGRLKSETTLIFTETVLEKILQNHEKKIKKFATVQNAELFVCNDGVKLAELIVSDCGMIISLFDSNGRFYHDYIYCAGSQAITWATELFEFYKSRSWRVGSKAVNQNLVYT